MALCAASLTKYARSLTTQVLRARGSPQISPYIRSFSSTSAYSSLEQRHPIDSLVADAIQTENHLEANPPRKATRTKSTLKEQPATEALLSPQVDLPPREDWGKYFINSMETRGRRFISNPEYAKTVADACVPEGSKDKIILEAFPGPGAITRALLDLPKDRIKKLIVMEDYPTYLDWLKPLQALDSRLIIVPLSGYFWKTYEHLSSCGFLDDVQTIDWSQEHPQLQFISHVPDTVIGEQLMSQLLRCIPDRSWLFQYGRVPLNLIITEHLSQRISDPPGTVTRCKLGVIADATASYGVTLPTTPYKQNFYPPGKGSRDFLGMRFIPLEEPVIESGLLDDWDYVLRRLFVQKATPVSRSIPSLAPGAGTLVKKVTADSLSPDQRLNIKLNPRQLTAKEWNILIKAFADWPFKPEDLSIDSYHFKRNRQDNNNKNLRG